MRLLLVLLLAGCASPGTLPTGPGVACTAFDALLYGRVTTVYIGTDKTSGDVSVAADCSVEVRAKK
jgi:hypothetical protein